jgi:transglutaminase-like putative cysteine protease
MARTILLYLLPAFLVATHWSRLEESGSGDGRLLWIVVLALLPALLRPRWARVAAYVVAAALAVRLAFELSPVRALPFRDGDFLGPLSSRLWRGFEAFFTVELPINPAERPAMHGVILLAVFGFCAVLAVAIATRRPLLASAALIAGAGWPATILTGRAELERGAIILAAALLLFAGMRSMPTLDVRQPLLAGAAIVIAAVAVSTSPSVAKGEFVDGWRTWDVSLGDAPSVGVEYVWDSNYAGIRFPQKPTTVLSVDADQQAGVYWRATTLDLFGRGRWLEDLHEGAEPAIDGDLENLSADPYLPPAARNPGNWLESRVEVEGLRDTHLIAAAAPVAYEPGDRVVDYFFSNVAVAAEGIGRGDSYTVYSYAPKPTPKQLARSTGVYPAFVSETYLTVEGSPLPAFGEPGREALLEEAAARNPRLADYADVYRQAQDVVGDARNPYSAVVALETWFRSGGDFVYDEQPPVRRDAPALASFVVATRRGYCQHFAGAMALMLRQLGIPARVAAGFTSGRYDNDDGRWIVTDRNAHTWVEVWFDGYGWLSFDPTPGRGQLGGTYTASSLRFDVDGAIAAAGNAADAATSDLLRGETGGPDRPRGADPGGATASGGGRSAGRSTGTGIVTLLLLAALAAAVLLTAAKIVRRAARFLTRDPRGLAGACRRDLAAFMTDQGVSVPTSATPREVGAIAEREFGVDPGPLMAEVTLARFGPPETAGPAAARARRELRRIRKALRARLSIPRRTRGLLSIRSLGV